MIKSIKIKLKGENAEPTSPSPEMHLTAQTWALPSAQGAPGRAGPEEKRFHSSSCILQTLSRQETNTGEIDPLLRKQRLQT